MKAVFEFATAGRIIFGAGTAKDLGREAASLAALRGGGPAFVVAGRDGRRFAALASLFEEADLEYSSFSVGGEPSFDLVRSALSAARETDCRVVVGVGGGSVIDTAKAVAALLANPGDPLDYAEVIGAGKPLSAASLPCIAVPTTAGTGSEATRNAVLVSLEHRAKVSLRSPTMLPALALVDPELCRDLPPGPTASTGMDALTQLIEPFLSNRANPLTDALCREGMARAASSLLRAYRDGGDGEAREGMSLASLFGGISLANARLGAVHGFAAAIGAAYRAPHGAVCAALLPRVTAVNLRALRSRAPEHPALGRYAEIATILHGGKESPADDCASALLELSASLDIEGLAAYGCSTEDFPELIAKAKAASSMQGNPISLEDDELLEILNDSLYPC